MQTTFRPFYFLLRQQDDFEWNLERQKKFDGIKALLTEQNQLLSLIPINCFLPCAPPLILDSNFANFVSCLYKTVPYKRVQYKPVRKSMNMIEKTV